MTMYFEPDFSTPTLVVSGIALLATLILCIGATRRIRRVTAHRRLTDRTDGDSAMPELSVVVYVRDNSWQLEQMLPVLLSQEYPAGFEVVVAIDGKSEQSIDVVKRLSVEHRNLRITFVPDEAHALSRKKLALTLGVKGCRYGHVVLTDAAVNIPSYEWLSGIGRHFAQGSEVVLGHVWPYDISGKPMKAISAFDELNVAVDAFSEALKGRPYRATAANIAFKKDLFVSRKGFADSVGFHHGEDDIFVKSLCRDSRCAVELSPQTQLGFGCQNVSVWHKLNKLSHLFTGKFVSRRASLKSGFYSLAAWAWLSATVCAGVMFFPNLLPLAVSLLAGIIWMTVLVISWHSAAKALCIPQSRVLLPILFFVRPIYNYVYRLKSRQTRDCNYTWTRPH